MASRKFTFLPHQWSGAWQMSLWILCFGIRNPFGGLRHYSMSFRSKGKHRNSVSSFIYFFSRRFAPKSLKMPKMVNEGFFGHFPSGFAMNTPESSLTHLWWEVGYFLPTLYLFSCCHIFIVVAGLGLNLVIAINGAAPAAANYCQCQPSPQSCRCWSSTS